MKKCRRKKGRHAWRASHKICRLDELGGYSTAYCFSYNEDGALCLATSHLYYFKDPYVEIYYGDCYNRMRTYISLVRAEYMVKGYVNYLPKDIKEIFIRKVNEKWKDIKENILDDELPVGHLLPDTPPDYSSLPTIEFS